MRDDDDVLPASAEPLHRMLCARRHANNHSLLLAAGALVPALVEQALSVSGQRVVVVHANTNAAFDYRQLQAQLSPESLVVLEPNAAAMIIVQRHLEGWRDHDDRRLIVVLHGLGELLVELGTEVQAVAAMAQQRSVPLWLVLPLGPPPARFSIPATAATLVSSCALRATNTPKGIPLLIGTATPGDHAAALHLPALGPRQALVWSNKVSLHTW
jgi:hypothetical protein